MRSVDTFRSVVRFRRPEVNPARRRLARSASVADLRRVARRRLPRGIFDYVDGGAEGEVSLRRNVAAFERIEFRPRVLRAVDRVDPSVSLFGRPLPIPLVQAPTGFTRSITPGGELDVARAAARAGVPYTLSTLGTRSIAEVAAVSSGPKWFQVYVWKDRGLVADMLARATHCGYEAIVLTVDMAVLGRRERDVRRGFSLPPKVGPGTIFDGMVHPSWSWDFMRADPITFANVVGTSAPDGTAAARLADYVNAQFDPSLSWRDLDWFRARWKGPIVLKGVQTVADARLAADAGIEAVALSNHGGRQLDGAPAIVDLVPRVADAVGGSTEVLCDGGVRSGGDILKAVALGARACMAGRAYLYGLAAAGEAGVDHVLDLFDGGIRRTMALLGCREMGDVNRDLVGQTVCPD